MTEYLHAANTAKEGTARGACYTGNSVFFSGIRKTDNNIIAGRINELGTELTVLQASAESDIHSQPAIFADAQGYVYACVLDTNQQAPTIYKTATPEGLDFQLHSVVPIPSDKQGRYPQMFFDGAGDLWLFMNYSPSNNTRKRDIAYTKSSDKGITWDPWVLVWDAGDMRPYYNVQHIDDEMVIVATRTNPFDVSRGTNSGYFLKLSNGAWRDSSDNPYTLPITVDTAELCYDSLASNLNLGFGVAMQKDDLGRYFFIAPGYRSKTPEAMHLCRVENGVWTQTPIDYGLDTYTGSSTSGYSDRYQFAANLEIAGERQICEVESFDYGETWQLTQLTTGPAKPGMNKSSLKQIFGDNPKHYFLYSQRRWNATGGNFDWDSDYYSLFETTWGWNRRYVVELEDSSGVVTTIDGLRDLAYTAEGLLTNHTYSWRVKETAGSESSGWSTWQTFKTLAAPVEGSTFNLEWRDVTTQSTTTISGITGLSYALSNLTPGEGYEFRVQEVVGSDESAWSEWSAFTTESGSASVNITDSAACADSWLAVCKLKATIYSAASVSDTTGDAPAALASFDFSATGSAVVDAMASASGALTAGAAAGDSWSVQAQVLASMLSGAASSDDVARQTDSAISATIAAGTEASDQFMAALESIVSVSDGSTVGDAYVAVVAQLASITSGAIASDTFSLDFGFPSAIQSGAMSGATWLILAALTAELSDTVTASDLMSARASTTANLAFGAAASDRFSIVNDDIRYLVMGAIILQSALNYSVSIKP
ncbi:MAG: fibronectin type III domain-containing protein [Marinobacter sp.]